jgi:hypothetical protein
MRPHHDVHALYATLLLRQGVSLRLGLLLYGRRLYLLVVRRPSARFLQRAATALPMSCDWPSYLRGLFVEVGAATREDRA